jgi:hypothetical protein
MRISNGFWVGLSLLCWNLSLAQSNTTGATSTTVQGTLDEIASKLEEMYGYPITFEGPKYVFSGDLEDQTLQVRRDLDKYPPGQAPKVIGVVRNEFTIQTAVSSSPVDPAYIEARLREAVNAQNQSGQGARFHLEKDATGFHILPNGIRNKDGDWVDATPQLDTLITIPPATRSAWEMIGLIGNAVSAAAGMKGGLMGGPSFTLRNVEGNWSASNEPARTVLERVLTDPHIQRNGWRYGWSAGCIPAPAFFGFTITAIPPAPTPGPAPATPVTGASSCGGAAVSCSSTATRH